MRGRKLSGPSHSPPGVPSCPSTLGVLLVVAMLMLVPLGHGLPRVAVDALEGVGVGLVAPRQRDVVLVQQGAQRRRPLRAFSHPLLSYYAMWLSTIIIS